MTSLLELRSKKTATSQKVDNPARKHLFIFAQNCSDILREQFPICCTLQQKLKKVLIYHFDLISCMFIVFNIHRQKLWILDKLA